MRIDNRYKVEKVVCKDQTRSAITSAYLDTQDETAKLVATNGHTMAIIQVEADKAEAGMVPLAAIIESRRLNKKLSTSRINLNDDCKLDNGATFERGNEKFPDWRRIKPVEEKTFRVALNARLLHDLADALGSDDGKVSIEFLGNLKGPMRVYAWDKNNHIEEQNLGIIMPLTEK